MAKTLSQSEREFEGRREYDRLARLEDEQRERMRERKEFLHKCAVQFFGTECAYRQDSRFTAVGLVDAWNMIYDRIEEVTDL